MLSRAPNDERESSHFKVLMDDVVRIVRLTFDAPVEGLVEAIPKLYMMKSWYFQPIGSA